MKINPIISELKDLFSLKILTIIFKSILEYFQYNILRASPGDPS